GRFLQERVLERNRLALLESDGVDGLLTRREERGIPRTIRCAEVVVGDHLRIAPGELIPVDAIVETAARFSLDWINGESRAQSFEIGDVVPAGAFLASDRAVVVVACTAFAESPLVDLLKTTTVRTNERPMSTPWWQRVTKLYVALVLAAALVGFVGWTLVTHDLAKSLEVATAVLVVTCPCAFGIATPLGYELVQAGLRRAGLYVRSATFLDRAESVRTVVFDKTGTLTLGATSLRAPSALSALSIEERAILGSIAAASHHPKSVAVATAIGDVVAANDVIETVGGGLSLRSNGHDYRLGAPAWVDASARTKADLAFGVDGRILVELPTRETLRPDARAEIAKLRNAGTNVFLLSGDAPARVQEAAIDVGISTSNAMGGVSASDKARWVDAHQHDDLLMIGDGLNDALVADVAFTSGTPAIDRPFLATRSDFYFVTPGLGCIRLALEASKALGRVRRRNLRLALGYNAIAVVLAYAGVMSPLVCAVFMPVTSLSVVLTTVASLDSRSALWRS
ncbi:MAG TPA: HAD-IC family P-type ATPase, partial [Polyangiaceae bacterium]